MESVYFIVLFFLVFILLCSLTWTLKVWHSATVCFNRPDIWCFNTWKCGQNATVKGRAAPCYAKATNPSGLAECLYGYTQGGAQPTCIKSEDGTCACGIGETRNCLSKCAGKLSDLGPDSVCCCNPEDPSCYLHKLPSDQIPAACRGTN